MKLFNILKNLIARTDQQSTERVNEALERGQYTLSFESFMSVKNWGFRNVFTVGGIHFICLWGIYSSRAITSDTKIGNVASGTYKVTTGILNDGAIVRIESNGDLVANFFTANKDYFGLLIAVEASHEIGGVTKLLTYLASLLNRRVVTI